MLAMKIGSMLLALIVLDDDPNSPKINETRAGIRSFRLEGTWASDCSKASSRENQYIEFEISSIGYPTMFDNDKEASEGWIIFDAKRISSLRLRIKIESLRGVDRTVTIDKVGDGVRFYQVFEADGTLMINGGRIVGSNRETPLLKKCRD